jgi:two-component system, chemotaxis family, chemotaxis protein CheY
MKILICDDSLYIQEKMASFLMEYNFDIIQANNGKEAVKLAATEKPNIIIMDIYMPELDGISAMQEIKKQMNVPIIILSNIGQQTKIIESLQKGADEYIIKPFDPGKLLAIINKYTSENN